jgi:PAS domain S-box-containing protein
MVVGAKLRLPPPGGKKALLHLRKEADELRMEALTLARNCPAFRPAICSVHRKRGKCPACLVSFVVATESFQCIRSCAVRKAGGFFVMNAHASAVALLDQQLNSPFSLISLLADAMPQLVWITDPLGEVLYYSNRVNEFSGASKNAEGRWEWKGMLHPDDLQPTAESWQAAISTGGVYEMEHRTLMKDGSYRWHLSRAFPQRNEAGEIERWFGTATDIHEQKLAEVKIKEAEARWRTALEATEIGTWEYDFNQGSFYLSELARQIRGIAPGQDLGFPLDHGSLHPDDADRVIKVMEDTIAGSAAGLFTIEYRVKHPHHSGWRWLRSIGRLVQGEGTDRVIGILQDITEQKEAEEKFHYLVTLTQSIADAVIGTDTEHRVSSWNSGAEKLYGWKAEEVLGQFAPELLQTRFFSEEENEDWANRFNALGYWQGEVTQLRKGGDRITILASVAKIVNSRGEHIGGVAVNKDITEQRAAAQQLKESEELFRILTNSIPQIVWVTDGAGTMQYLNDQWERITGQAVEEGLTNALEMMHPDDRQPMQDQWIESLEQGRSFQREFRLRNQLTGNYRWYLCSVQPVRDAGGHITRWIGASSDIQPFKDLSVVLEQQVQQRTRELEQLTDRLKQQTSELQRSNEDLQQFAHVASHDLKEPLRKIKTYGSRLVDEFGEVLPAEARAYLEKMESAASRMSTMIDGVLGYSLLGVTENKPEPVDLQSVVAQILDDLEVLFQQKGARLHCQPLPEVDGMPILLYQLFYNLIGNALKFCRPDCPPEVTIRNLPFRKEAAPAGFSPLPFRRFAHIQVSDNGIGFDAAYARHIFKPFTRLHAKDRFEGTGLGLSLCQKIVERHGGAIWADGVTDGGAVFNLLLPLGKE